MAVELATLAGAQDRHDPGGISRRYKTGAAGALSSLRDPVSEIDRRVETLIRARLAERFPSHDIIGEEMEERPGRGSGLCLGNRSDQRHHEFRQWLSHVRGIDRCLAPGAPVAGAVWCSVSHALRAGVYHASIRPQIAFRRQRRDAQGQCRRTSSSGWSSGCRACRRSWLGNSKNRLGCARMRPRSRRSFLEVARFSSPNIWDVAAGIALVQAGGGVIREHDGMRWMPMRHFAPAQQAGEKPDLRAWRRPIVVGTKKGVETMCGEMPTQAP